MIRRVWACDAEKCPICGGEIEQVDPVLVAMLAGFEAGVSVGRRAP